MSLGVPFSTQWSPEGYFYPVQIAQYGLAAYSRNVTTSSYDSQAYTLSVSRLFLTFFIVSSAEQASIRKPTRRAQ